jgi:hypothetical protein
MDGNELQGPMAGVVEQVASARSLLRFGLICGGEMLEE